MTALNVIELETAIQPQFSVIWLHGLGASADDFVPVAKALNLPPQHAVRFIFPQAPQQPVTVNGGYIMPAWYDILEMSALARKVDSAGILRSIKQIEQLIVRENQRGVATSDIFLAGFSQGGAIAYQTALAYPERLAGVIALSTYMAEPAKITQHMQPAQAQLPVFVAHGRADDVVSLGLGQQAFATLQMLGCQPQWHDYPMRHEVCMPEIDAIRHWLIEQMVHVAG